MDVKIFSVFALFFLIEAFPFKHLNSQSQDKLSNSTDADVLIKKRISVRDNTYVLTYILGCRMNGDHLEARKSDVITQSTPQDYTQLLTYPANGGYGRQITYVEVVVEQSGIYGDLRILEGGVGQLFIKLAVTAINTKYFNYNATLYAL